MVREASRHSRDASDRARRVSVPHPRTSALICLDRVTVACAEGIRLPDDLAGKRTGERIQILRERFLEQQAGHRLQIEAFRPRALVEISHSRP